MARNPSRVVLVGVAALLGTGCESDTERANQVAREYVRAATRGDTRRLCALRTDGSLRRWGGRAACERRARGLAFDPLPRRAGPGLRRRLERKGLSVDPATAKVIPDDTSSDGVTARVEIDFGRAMIDDGHAVGGEIIEMDLKEEAGAYRVIRLGFAAFAD